MQNPENSNETNNTSEVSDSDPLCRLFDITDTYPSCSNFKLYDNNYSQISRPYNQLVDHLWNQADMCMIIRSMVMNGKMPMVCKDTEECKDRFVCGSDDEEECRLKFPQPVPENKVMETAELLKNMFVQIRCPGADGTKVCALNGDSQYNPSAWMIAFKPMFIKLGGDEEYKFDKQ